MEMQMQQVMMTGRIAGDLITRKGPDNSTTVYFRVRCGDEFYCMAEGKAAANLLRFCRDGDEVALEGKLVNKVFNDGPMILVYVRFVSFGRKKTTLRE